MVSFSEPFGFRWDEIWLLVERHDEIAQLKKDFTTLPILTVWQKHGKLINEIRDAFADPNVKISKQEAVQKVAVAMTKIVPKSERDVMERATRNVDNG